MNHPLLDMPQSLLDKYLSHTKQDQRRSDVIAYLATLDHLEQAAPSIAHNIIKELQDQRSYLKLIASENFCSLTVQLAMGNLLTDKYCEGFPYHRFYAGCENVDAIEAEAAELAQQLFNVSHAYVQPHSGADANLVAFWAILNHKIQEPFLGEQTPDKLSPADFEKLRQKLCNQKFLGLSLSSGGHLTHGFRQNVSAKMMQAVSYDVDRTTGLLNYDEIAQIARLEKPLILLAGYSAYPRRINFAKMRAIADEVGAVLMVDMAHFAGLVAGKEFQGEENPTSYADVLTSTTHKTLRGPRGGLILCSKDFAESVDKGCPLVLGGPLPHVIAAKAIAFREASQPSFAKYTSKIVENARTLAEQLMKRGISVVTKGTDNHIVLIDLTPAGLTGRIGETALRNAGITANRNMVPFDPNGAWYTSGIRLGTPALTTLGMGKQEMSEVADIIASTLRATQPQTAASGQPSKAKGMTSPEVLESAKKRVAQLLSQFPLYPELQLGVPHG